MLALWRCTYNFFSQVEAKEKLYCLENIWQTEQNLCRWLCVNSCDSEKVITHGAGSDYSVAESHFVMKRKNAKALVTPRSHSAGVSFLPLGPRRQAGLCERPGNGGSTPSRWRPKRGLPVPRLRLQRQAFGLFRLFGLFVNLQTQYTLHAPSEKA